MSGFQKQRGVARKMLRRAVAQTGDGGAVRAVDLKRQQIVAAHADAPTTS